MAIEALISAASAAIKFPFFQAFKLLVITPLNFIPTKIFEVHGIGATGPGNRPDLRELKSNVVGRRRLHAGCALIAHLRGVIIDAYHGSNTQKFRGVYTEDFQDIQRKWTY
jgi:hypothetical protein